jgi:hypothetical protein
MGRSFFFPSVSFFSPLVEKEYKQYLVAACNFFFEPVKKDLYQTDAIFLFSPFEIAFGTVQVILSSYLQPFHPHLCDLCLYF